MGKDWELCDLSEEKISHNDPWLVKLYDNYTMIEYLQRKLTYRNKDLSEPIREVTLAEKRNLETLKLQSRVIEVKFGNITLTQLNILLSERKLDQINEKEIENGFSFQANTHKDVVKILSTLNALSRFSKEMKNTIVNYLASNKTLEDKLELREKLFNRYTKAQSIFSSRVTIPSEHTLNEGEVLTPKP